MGKEEIRTLRALASEPEAQVAYALELLERICNAPKRGRNIGDRELTQSVLRVLIHTPAPDARADLLRLYARYAENGVAFDPGGYTRASILTALRPSLMPSDRELLTAAAMTYEFPPPEFKEETAPLRGTAIVALNELDDMVSRFHAARLLADEYTDRMSGEPALSAVRVLGTQGENLLLYHYAAQPETATLPEVLSESLRHLTDLPVSLVTGLIERHGESKHEVVLAGLIDLLLTHETPLDKRSESQEFIRAFLEKTEQYDLYQYFASTAVAQIAGGNESIWDVLKSHVKEVRDAEKVHILQSALSIIAYNTEVAEYLELLQQRIDD